MHNFKLQAGPAGKAGNALICRRDLPQGSARACTSGLGAGGSRRDASWVGPQRGGAGEQRSVHTK